MLVTRSTSLVTPGFCERRAMTCWRIAIPSPYAATARGRSNLAVSSLTARCAHFNASVNNSLEDSRGGRGGDGSLGGCFRWRRV